MTDVLGILNIEICRHDDAVNVAKLFKMVGKLYSLDVGIN
jgi:hypothetical protein